MLARTLVGEFEDGVEDGEEPRTGELDPVDRNCDAGESLRLCPGNTSGEVLRLPVPGEFLSLMELIL